MLLRSPLCSTRSRDYRSECSCLHDLSSSNPRSELLLPARTRRARRPEQTLEITARRHQLLYIPLSQLTTPSLLNRQVGWFSLLPPLVVFDRSFDSIGPLDPLDRRFTSVSCSPSDSSSPAPSLHPSSQRHCCPLPPFHSLASPLAKQPRVAFPSLASTMPRDDRCIALRTPVRHYRDASGQPYTSRGRLTVTS